MSIALADSGALQILKKYFADTNPVAANLTLHLFTNDITPADTDTTATYTEAAGGGYAPKTLTAASWTVSAVGGIAQAAQPQQTFTFTGALDAAATVYGYYITDNDTTPTLIYAERSATSFTPANNGDALLMTPALKISAGTPA